MLHPYQFAIDEENAKKIMDLRGLIKYTKDKGVKVQQLTEKEKMSFVK